MDERPQGFSPWLQGLPPPPIHVSLPIVSTFPHLSPLPSQLQHIGEKESILLAGSAKTQASHLHPCTHAYEGDLVG